MNEFVRWVWIIGRILAKTSGEFQWTEILLVCVRNVIDFFYLFCLFTSVKVLMRIGCRHVKCMCQNNKHRQQGRSRHLHVINIPAMFSYFHCTALQTKRFSYWNRIRQFANQSQILSNRIAWNSTQYREPNSSKTSNTDGNACECERNMTILRPKTGIANLSNGNRKLIEDSTDSKVSCRESIHSAGYGFFLLINI